ncbi:MAG: hypothetical protein H6817_06410 [Phycisphaerales bacterium]|nr:hypothetical protein [Phycisphaerales bacterium]
MALNVIMITGPRRSGKSALAAALIAEVCTSEPHYIRLAAQEGTKRPPLRKEGEKKGCGVATATWVNYDPRLVFETLPATLAAVQRRDRVGCVLIEADTDPNLINAYPYDTHIFTVPAPEKTTDVFRSPYEAKQALQSALHDTSAFVGEIFGVCADVDDSSDDSLSDGSDEERPDMSDSQIVELMRSPLGEQLASRIQCHSEYHGLLDSDAIVVNTGVGGVSEAVDEVVHRLEKLARQTRRKDMAPIVFCCDVRDQEDPRRQKLFAHLKRRYEDCNGRRAG